MKPESIIYAEFAGEGAMGDAGSVRIITIEDKILKSYYFNIFKKNKDNTPYVTANEFLTKLGKKRVLSSTYAGFGNTVWKKQGAVFERDDDNASYIYKEGTHAYVIPTSNRGVYFHSVATLAKRKVTIEKLEAYLEQIKNDLTWAEYFLFANYIAQSKRTDSGISWFNITPFDYIRAINYIKHVTGTEFVINDSDFKNDLYSIELYRLNFATTNLGWNKIDEIFSTIVLKGEKSVFKRLNEALGVHVETIFTKLNSVDTNFTDFKLNSSNNFLQLFDYPVLVNFTPDAHRKIIDAIIKMGPGELRSSAVQISFYFANYKFNEDKLSYADVLPAVVHVIKNLPADDKANSHTGELFWIASDIVDTVWRYIDESEEYQEKYRNLIYNLFWPRVGGVWPIAHYGEFTFKEPVADTIFNDSLSFVLSLKDILKRNKELKEYFTPYMGDKFYKNEHAARAGFRFSLEGLDAKRQFDRIMATYGPDDARFYLHYPRNIEEADFLLKELFKTKENKFTGLSRLATLEDLIITPNTIGVGEYILNYLNKHFDDLVALVKTDIGDQYDFISTMKDYFIAISKGITEENEFSAFSSIAKKMIALGCKEEVIKAAEKYARHHRRAILFQRSSLAKIFND